jgi:hypothetical protein
MSLASPSEFKIYNLSEQTRDIVRQGSDIEVSAGWQNFSERSVYKGGIKAVLSSRKGSDIVTSISTGPLSFKAEYAMGQYNFPAGGDIRAAALKIARDIPDASVADADFKSVGGKFGEGGWTATGSPQDCLIKLADEFGFNAWADNNKVICQDVKKVDKDGSRPIWEISGDGGTLIEINPVYVGSYKDGIKQVTIKSLFIPGLKPGSKVEVKSTLNKQFNKVYSISSISSNISAYTDSWTMSLTCFTGGTK